MTDERILSADSHIVEPADFWTRHIDPAFAERAPRAHTDDGGIVHFTVNGGTPLGSVGAPSQAGVRFENPEQVTFEGAMGRRPAGLRRSRAAPGRSRARRRLG